MRRLFPLLAATFFAVMAAAQTPGELAPILGRPGATGGTGKPLIAFISAATTYSATAAINASVPSTQTGDILVAFLLSSAAITASPSGWTRIETASDSSFAEADIYYHPSSGASEPSTYAWSQSTANSGLSVQMRNYRFMNSNPLDGNAGVVNFTTTTANCQIPSMANTSVDNELYVGFWSNTNPSNNVITPPPGLSNIVTDSNPADFYLVGADQIVGPAGSSVAPKNATFAQTFNGCAGVTLKPQ